MVDSRVRAMLLILLMMVISIVQVNFVGDNTIYSLKSNQRREVLHEAIIHDQPPEGGWAAHGANDAINIRIAIPYLVEFIHRATGVAVVKLYKEVDLVCLWLALLVLFQYLRFWFTEIESTFACLYVGAVLPLTFAYHIYHPYDRASLLAWLLAIWCARAARFGRFLIVTMVAVLVKYDAIVLPGLYFLGNVTARTWRKIFLQTGSAGIVLLAEFILLFIIFHGQFLPHYLAHQIFRNIGLFVSDNISYAPFLAFALPVILSILGYRDSDQFARASLWFAGLVIAILFIATNFEEVRAESMMFPLLAPAALSGLRRVLGGAPLRAEVLKHSVGFD